jgi:hypothetical protein
MKLLILAVAIAIFGNAGFAQEARQTTPPASVISAFLKKFPGSSNTKWEKEGADYEANFSLDNKKMSAVFTGAGALKETESAINMSELPDLVGKYIKEHYQFAKIKETVKITKANGTINYEVEIDKKDLVFDEAGKFIGEEKD